MGGGLCRSTPDGAIGPPGTDGLCRKIVVNYAKQWTSHSDKSPKTGGTNTKHNRNRKKKPVISAPLPADPDRLEGDKWRYVILTRLDTEPPPERPPRQKRRRPRQDPAAADGADVGRTGSGRWGSGRRRPSYSRGGRGRPPRPVLRADIGVGGGGHDVSADELMRLVLDAFRRRAASRTLPPWTPDRPVGQAAAAAAAAATKEATAEKYTAAATARDVVTAAREAAAKRVAVRGPRRRPEPVGGRRNGLFESVVRVRAMADSLLS